MIGQTVSHYKIVWWAGEGNELFYQIDNHVMKVVVETIPSFTVSTPRLLFELPESSGGIFGITPDGSRFISRRLNPNRERITEIHVVLGWFDELKGKTESD